MKSKLLIGAVVAMQVLAGCSNDETVIENSMTELRLRSGVEVQHTRSFTASQSTAIAGDEIVSVWVDDVNRGALYNANQLTSDGANGFTGNAMYFPQTGNSVNIYAIHGLFATPFKADDAFPESPVKYTVADNQTTTADYLKSDLLYAYSANVARTKSDVNLTFYHMLSKVEVAIKIGNGAPELAGTNAVRINNVYTEGLFSPSQRVDMAEQAARAGMMTLAENKVLNSIVLGQSVSSNFIGNDVIYNEAVLVPQDMAGKLLVFTLADGGILKYAFPANTKFESGKKYRYKIELNLTELKVTSEIVDWITGAEVEGEAEMSIGNIIDPSLAKEGDFYMIDGSYVLWNGW